MAPLNKLEGVFALFSCIVFELNYAKTDLLTCAAVHGASEGWDYMRKNPGQVYVDIERRGPSLVGGEPDWHVDVITRAYGAGRYDCWFSARYASLEHASLAAQWLSQHDWKVLRDKAPERNGARRLSEGEAAQLAAIAPYYTVPPLGTPSTVPDRGQDMTQSQPIGGWPQPTEADFDREFPGWREGAEG